MPVLFPARVSAIQSVAEAQVFLRLDVPREVWSAHIHPAQYIEFALPDMEPWRGTIANRPGCEFFEFLVKDVGKRSHRITELKSGDEILVSKPKGPGFPVAANRRNNVILAASGVAICAIRPVIMEILLERGEWRRVMLYYGERTADRFAFIEEREFWREERIEVHLSASRPAEGTYYRGHTGYVQDHLLEIAPDIRDTVAFIAGKDEMVDGFTDALMRLGLLPNRIFLNI